MAIIRDEEPVKQPEKKAAKPTTPSNARTIGIDPDDLTTVNKGGVDVEVMKDGMRPMLEDAAWKQPTWLKRKKGDLPPTMNYEFYYLNSLRARYLKLEGDFRTLLGNYFNSEYMDFVIAKRISGYLQTAKTALESDEANVEDVVVMLNYVDQSMVWLYPRHYAKEYAYGLATQLKGKGDAWGDYLADELNRDGQTLGGIRAALERTKEAINQTAQENIIASGLQVERLRTARQWGVYVLAASIVLLPMLMKFESGVAMTQTVNPDASTTVTTTVNALKSVSSVWDDTFVVKYLQGDWARTQPWAIALCVVAFGAAGGFFSSLMAVRDVRTRASLQDFREKLKDNQLKIIIGCISALILTTFLTWEIIPGVSVNNAGGYLFLAFVAGFSERYFLRLLNIEDENAQPMPAAPDAKAVQRPSVANADAAEGEGGGGSDADGTDAGDVNNRSL